MAAIGVLNGTRTGLAIRTKLFSNLFLFTSGSNSILIDKYRLKSTGNNVFDSFTDRMLNQRGDKTEILLKDDPKKDHIDENLLRLFSKDKTNNSTSARKLYDVQTLDATELTQILNAVIKADDNETFISIVEQLIQHQILPTEDTVLRILSNLCRISGKSIIKLTNDFIQLCRTKNLSFYEQNCEFSPYIAHCLWGTGRYKAALNILKQLYSSENLKINKIVRLNYRALIQDAIVNKDDTVAIIITTHAIDIYKTFNDATILLYVWYDSFTSDLYYNQDMAKSLFGQYKSLRMLVGREIQHFVVFLLECQNTDKVHRLIEQVGLERAIEKLTH